jgi:Zn-dependent oligopeptidase
MRDYTTLTAADVAALTAAACSRADELVANAAATAGAGNWDAVLAPLDEAFAVLAIAYGEGAFMARVHLDPAVRDAGQAAEEKLTKWRVDLPFREDLNAAVVAYAGTGDAAGLEGERARFLDHLRRDLRRAGHDLAPDRRAELQALRARLVELEVAFQRNIDEYSDGLEVTGDDLAGLPASYVEGLRAGEAPGTLRVSLDYPEYYPFMDEADRRDLRERLEFKMYNQAREANTPLLAEALELRRRIATLLGYPSWAHVSMELKMAGEPGAVRALYDGIIGPVRAKAGDELRRMEAILVAEGQRPPLRTWDWRYYDTKLLKTEFAVDPTEVSAYFPLGTVLEGMFGLTGEVFGLRYRALDASGAWHPDVSVHEIRDATDDRLLAVFAMDLFPREGKFGHAAAFPLVVARRLSDGSREVPFSAIVANFTKPGADRPSLLRHDEVLTLFHEFGHILHMSLSQAELARFSGADTEWDFVEAPSQIMEHWCWDAGVLGRFARHHATGEPIPSGLVERLVASRDLNVGVKTARQCSFGLLDLAIHGEEPVADLDAVNRRASAVTGLPFHEGTFFPAGFGHLMGGYDAGYYGYLWAKVYGDDMFSRFEAEGVTSPAVGAAYRREILEPNGARDAIELLRAFLGREPSSAAFLRELGIEAVGARA